MNFVKEAYIHAPESKPSEHAMQVLSHLFYGDPEDPIGTQVPMGFTDLLRRVQFYHASQKKTAKTVITNAIRQEHIVWFYNRQTIVQIFFRFPKKERFEIPLHRPEQPFTEVQMDSLFISKKASRKQAQERELPRDGVPLSNIKNQRFLLAVDSTSRKILGVRQVINPQPHDLPIKTAEAAIKILHPYFPRLHTITTDDGNEYGEHFQTLLRTHGLPEHVKFQVINKKGSLMGHPGKLAPAETAIRGLREYIEKYNTLRNTPMFSIPAITEPQMDRLVNAYNDKKHSALQMGAFSPNEFVDQQRLHTSQYTIQNGKIRQQMEKARECSLKVHEIVRILRTKGPFDKQSLPTLTCGLYKVTNIHEGFVDVDRIPYPSEGYHGPLHVSEQGSVERTLPVHHTRIVRIKTDELFDPPAWTGYHERLKNIENDEQYDSEMRREILFQDKQLQDPHVLPPEPPKVQADIQPPALRRSERLAAKRQKT